MKNRFLNRSFILTYLSSIISYILINWIIFDVLFNITDHIGIAFLKLVFTIIYSIVLLILFFSNKNEKPLISRGFVWALVTILIYFFTIGGCGFPR